MNCSRSALLRVMFLGLPALALASDARPHCDAKHLGQFWPEPKSDHGMNIQQLAGSGDLQVCARTEEWRYGWQRLTITVEQLKIEPKKTASSSSEHSPQN